MADQQRKVSLIFEANASQAKNEINGLVQSLQKIQSMPRSLIDPTGIKEASKAAMELQGHIQKAVNVDTGKLDLSRFATSLASSGKSLDHYRDTLMRIGPEGSAAFRSVLSSINNAEVSTVRLTKGMRDFLTTMKNTAKWQISSSIMHGLIGGLQSAWGYAQSLDRSLNDIRIVTGQTSEQMARFAAEANKAAQTLSTTTTKYTDAALIFYQQGLGDNAVKERTEAVIKMANVTGEAAKDVSSYMTAIWNNFDKGTKPLEYYGDVITKLGAATAASSEEIAGGLEKFAAIANTIGLSYEYATSMITTIVDKTRQSEDVVGTALKTILARIQGLNLGETLEDGTTLNKYSEALATVGVHIKDASGQIKNMDVILDDLGAKWGTLGKDTQIALAQVVGGVRQYNQIISLMDHWGSFEKNVGLAQMSSGTLNEQADIYAESWEAARDRVRAAAEGIYDALINEDVFIKLDNIFTGLLNGVGGVVKGMGGMVPILGTIGGVITQKFAKEMPVALHNMKQNLMVLSGQANKEALKTQQSNTLIAQDMVSRADDSYEASQFETIRRISKMKEELIKNQHRMNSAQIEEYQALIQNEQAIRNIIDERAKSLALLEEEVQTMKEMLGIETAMNASDEQMENMFGEEAKEDIKNAQQTDKYKALKTEEARLESLMLDPTEDGTSDAYKRHAAELQNIRNQLSAMDDKSIHVFEKYSQYIQSAAGELADFSAKQSTAARNANNLNKFLKPDNIKTYEGKLSGLKAVLETWNATSFQSEASTKYLKEALDALGKEGAEETEVMNTVTEAVKKMAMAEAQAAADAKLLADAKAQELIKAGADPKAVLAFQNKSSRLGPSREENLEGNEPQGPEIKPRGNIEVLTQAAGTLMSTYSALNAVISASNTLMDENATAMEKAGAVVGALTSITFAATGVMGLYKTLKESQIVINIKETGTKLASAAATTTEGAAYGFLTTMIKGAQAAVGSFMASNPIGWILAIVAAVVALGVAIANIDWRSDEEKYLDNLKKKSEALSKAQENLAQHISDVESAWDNYQSMVTALEECTIGTEAWNDALLKCNQSATSLLAMAPGLAQFVQYNEDGSISLGGVGYEEYMQELNHKNAAMSSTGLILQNTIAQQQLDIYGDQDTYEQINAFLQANSDIFRADGKISTGENYSNFIQEIFTTFGKDLESATKFIAEIGLASTSGAKSLQNDYTNDGKISYDPRSSGETYAHYLNNEKNVAAAVVDWGNDLIQWDAYEKSTQTAFTTLFNTLEEFDTLNAKLYGNEFEETVDNALKDKTKAYFTSDKDSLKTLMVETFKGEEEDYAEMSVENMQYLLAVADVSGNLELMNSIVTQINDTLSSLNSAGQSLIRTGNLVQANLSKENRLNTIAYTGKQLQDTTIANPYSGFNEDTILEVANRERKRVLSDFEWATANEAVNKLSANIPVLEDTYELVKYYKDYTMAGFDRIGETFNVQAITEALNSAQDKVKQLQPSTPTQPPIAPVDSRGGTEMYDARTKVAQLQTDLNNANQAMLEATEREQENQNNFFNYIASWESLSALGAEKTQETNLLLMKTTADLLGIDLVPPEQFDSIEAAMMNYAGVLVNHLNEIDALATSSMESLDTLSVIVDSRPNGFPFSPEVVEQNSKSTTGMTTAELQSQGVFTTENINNFDPSWISNTYSEVEQLTSDLMSQLGYLEFDFDTQTEYFGKTFDSIVDLYNYLVNPDNQEGILNTIFKEFDNQIIDVLGIALEEGQTLIGYMQEHGGEYGLSLEGIENGYEQREAILSHLQSSEFAESQAQKSISSFLGYDFTSPEEFFEMFNADGAFDKQIEASGKTLEELNFSDILDMLFEQQVQAYRNDVLEWNKINSERFKSKLTVDSETGEFISPEGVKESDSDKLLRGLVDSGASTEDISSFIDGLSSITAGLTNEAFSDISTNLMDMIDDGADASKVLEAFNLILSETYSKGSELSDTEILKIMEKADLSTAEFSDEILNLTGIVNIAIQSLEGISSSFEKLVSTLSKAQELKDLTTGSELSEEDYKDLEKYIPEEYKDLFMRSANGYTFYGTEKEGLAVEKGSREAIWAEEERNRVTAQEAGVKLGFADNFNLETEGVGDSILNWIMNSGMKSELFSTFAAAAGIGPGEMEEIRAAQSNNEFTEKDGNYSYAGKNEVVSGALVELTNAIVSFVRGDFAGAGSEEAQLKMTGMQSTDELDQAVAFGDIEIGDKEGQVSKEQYDAIYNQKQLEEYETNFGLDKEELDDLGDTIQDMAESSKDAELGALGLSEALIEDAKAADEVAKELKRYDKALANVEDNYEDWQDALESDNLELQAEAVEEMDKAYSDLLDIDYDQLSSEFLTNKDNLKLLKEAAEGSEEAYDALQEAAGKDILMQVGLNTSKFDADKALIDAKLMEIEGKELEDIEVGASLNDQGFLNALTNMVNATGMSASQATDYLSSMGVDATVVENPVTTEEVVAHSLSVSTGVKTQAYTLAPTEPGGEAQRGVASYPIATYTAVPVTATKETGAVSLQVTSAGKSSGGGFKHANSSGGARRRRGGGGGGGGGGGSRAPQAEKKQSSDKERYHTVTNQLEDLTDAYDKVSKAADRAFGKSRIKLLREQQDALKDLAATQQDYLDEIDSYLKQDRSNLDQVSQYVGFDVQLDENGTITNFDAIQDAMWDEYNSHINDKDEVTDMDEEAWKEYEEEWERIMSLIEQYEETQDLRKEALQQLQDYINEIYDLQLEEVTYAVEVDIEASDDALEILDYLLGRIEDDAWKAAEAIAYMGNQAAIMLDQSNTYTSGIRDILMNHTEDIRDSEGRLLQKAQLTQADVEGFMAGDEGAINKLMGLNNAFTDEEIQSLRDYHSSLIEMNETLIELRESVFEKVLDSFEQFNEEMEESIDKMNHLTAITNYYKDVIDIVGKKNLGVSNTLLESLGQAGVEQGIQTVRMMAERRDTIKAEIESAEAAMRAAKSEEDIEHWKKVLKEMNQSLMEAEQEVLDSTTDTLQSIAEQYELVINNIGETLSDALAGPVSKSLEDLQTSFDRANTLTDHYLPDYEKIYELSKLNRDIVNSIDETDNIKAKQELASLQAEINALEESETKITEYQMENLRRRYELKLAEMALTEAQDAKSQVQMSRDADGNWSYVYTANEDQVAEAEQNYEDKLYAMQEANAEYIKTLGEEIINLRVEAHETLMGIANDLTLSEEERLIKLTEAQAFFNERESQLTGELAIVLGENQTLYEQDWTAYSNLTGYKISLDENYIDKFEETQLAVETGVNNINDFHATLAIGMEAAIQRVVDAMKVFSDSYEETTSYTIDQGKTFAESMTDHMNEVLEASENTANEFEEMGEKIETTFTDLTTAVQNWSNEYSSTIDSILEKNTILAESFNKVLAAYSKYTEATVGDSEPANETGDEEEPVEEPTTEEEPQKPEGLGTVSIKKGYQMYYRNGPGKGYKSLGIAKAKDAQKNYTYSKKEGKWVFIDALGGWMNGQYKRYTWLTPFDTGGYTGSWGSEGRVAMLHEKEIVLNKDDTANLLTAVDIIRQISKTIDLNAYSSAGYGNSLIRAGMGSAGTLEQHVQITAEFPNATNREEIYSAFTDIINLASQYANKK